MMIRTPGRWVGVVAIAFVMMMSIPALAGWRPEPRQETPAEWLTRLDRRLEEVHLRIRDIDALLTGPIPQSLVEIDAYVVVVQELAARGIVVLDDMEPVPWCARDYAALERTMFLAFGDLGDAWAAWEAGDQQVVERINRLIEVGETLLGAYGDDVRSATDCDGATATPSPAPTRTSTATARPSPTPDTTVTPVATP